MTLVTSNHKYELVSFFELEEKYQKKARRYFDWMEDIENEFGFFVYKKVVRNLCDFKRQYDRLIDEKSGRKFYANGVYSMSAFNGLAVQIVDNYSAVKIAYYYE
jgi:hypothetical protein